MESKERDQHDGLPKLSLPLNLLLIVRVKPQDENTLKVLAPVRLSFEESSKKVPAVFRKGAQSLLKSLQRYRSGPCGDSFGSGCYANLHTKKESTEKENVQVFISSRSTDSHLSIRLVFREPGWRPRCSGTPARHPGEVAYCYSACTLTLLRSDLLFMSTL